MSDEQFLKVIMMILLTFFALFVWVAVEKIIIMSFTVLVTLLVLKVSQEIRCQKGRPGVPETMAGKLMAGIVGMLTAGASYLFAAFFWRNYPGVGYVLILLMGTGAFLALRKLKIW